MSSKTYGFGTSWRQVVRFTPRPLYPRERAPSTHCVGGLLGPRAGLVEKRKNSFPYWESNPGTRSFITVFTTIKWSLSWSRWIQSIPAYFISLRSILILSSHLHLGLPNGSLLQVFPPKHSVELSFPMCATCPAHLILPVSGEKYKLWSSSCHFL
jgi:hypothetical protein